MIDAKQFIKALDELEATKGISKESIIKALKEAMEKGFVKQLDSANNGDLEEAKVRVDIDAKKGSIDMFILKNVVEEVEDDCLEISLEDANKEEEKYQIGDIYEIPVSTDDLTKLTAQNIKSVLRQKISEAEKLAIYEAFIDKKGEMIQGIVEKVDERSTIVNLGRTSVYLPNSQKIPGETFRVGEQIKLYIVDVLSTTKGAQINVSRSDAGFLKRLFEEEIHEIYEGIVMIKDIAREAGERSKIAVVTNDPNVDPIGACIGPNGSRIQKICTSLGNTKEKEKIDIIAYHTNPGLFIVEALKPATVVGVVLNEEEKRAIAVVRNNELSLAIGKRGVNARLAVKLTGWNIDIKEQDEAMKAGILYVSPEELKRQEDMKKFNLEQASEKVEETEEHLEQVEESETSVEEPIVEEKVEAQKEAAPEKVEAVEEQEEKVEKEVKVETTTVATKVKLADLEKELENEKKRRDRQNQYYSHKKKFTKDTDSEEEKESKEEKIPSVDRSTYMSIYTDEELEELDREEEDNEYEDEDEIDYDEFDSYYDDDNR